MVTNTDIALDNLDIDNSNKVGLYGEDLANVAGAFQNTFNQMAVIASRSQDQTYAISEISKIGQAQAEKESTKKIFGVSAFMFVAVAILGYISISKRR